MNQDVSLFNDTIAYNIGYGRPGATQEEIQQAAKAAQVHEAIQSFSQGYETEVGERGTKVSGGEKQRIALARALLYPSSVLLLDEATSALDSKTERQVLTALRDHRAAETGARPTVLMIAHRLSTLVDADQIIVMDGGRIAERGSHTELLEKGEAYRFCLAFLHADVVLRMPVRADWLQAGFTSACGTHSSSSQTQSHKDWNRPWLRLRVKSCTPFQRGLTWKTPQATAQLPLKMLKDALDQTKWISFAQTWRLTARSVKRVTSARVAHGVDDQSCTLSREHSPCDVRTKRLYAREVVSNPCRGVPVIDLKNVHRRYLV